MNIINKIPKTIKDKKPLKEIKEYFIKNEIDFYFSKALIEKKDKVYLDFLRERKNDIEKILNSFVSDNSRSKNRKEELFNLLKKTEEAIDEISS